MTDADATPRDDLLHCERCGDEIGEWTLVYDVR